MIKFEDIEKYAKDWSFYRSQEVQAKYERLLAVENNLERVKKILDGATEKILLNEFPYEMQALHFVAWFENEEEIVAMIRNKFRFSTYCFLESSKKSVPEYKHFHVFVKLPEGYDLLTKVKVLKLLVKRVRRLNPSAVPVSLS